MCTCCYDSCAHSVLRCCRTAVMQWALPYRGQEAAACRREDSALDTSDCRQCSRNWTTGDRTKNKTLILNKWFCIQSWHLCIHLLGLCIWILPASVLSSKMTVSEGGDGEEGGWKSRPCFCAQCSRAWHRSGWWSSRLRRWAAETLSNGLVLVLRSRAAWRTEHNLSQT